MCLERESEGGGICKWMYSCVNLSSLGRRAHQLDVPVPVEDLWQGCVRIFPVSRHTCMCVWCFTPVFHPSHLDDGAQRVRVPRHEAGHHHAGKLDAVVGRHQAVRGKGGGMESQYQSHAALRVETGVCDTHASIRMAPSVRCRSRSSPSSSSMPRHISLKAPFDASQ